VQGNKALSYEKVCRPYLDSVGAGSGPTIKKPFSGGQCATEYLVHGQLGGQDQAIGGLTPRLMTGPITFLGREEIATPGNPFPDSRRTLFNFQAAFGPSTVTVVWRASQEAPRTVRVERIDGQPDDCAPVPPIVTDPTPNPNPPTPIAPITIAPDIDIDVNVSIGPNGIAIINVGTGPITIDPFGDDDDGGGGGGGGLPPGDVGEPGDPVDTSEGGEAEDEAPEGEVLVGLRIFILSAPKNANLYRPGVYRGVCYVYMGTSEGLDHDPAGAMMTEDQFVFAEKDNLTKWKVLSNKGYNLRITPYYRKATVEEN